MGYTKTEIKTLLSELLACPVEDITDDRALEELGLDSLQFVSAIVAIEEKYNIEILDSDLLPQNFKDVSSICKTLEKYFSGVQTQLYKCIITDCDGVLWHGISGEDGEDLAYHDDATQKLCLLLHTLRQKGFLLAICSKNEPDNISAMLNMSALSIEDFAIIESNVSDKADTISSILDAFRFSDENAVYMDDSDAELAYIKSRHPSLTVLKADDIQNLTDTISSMFASIPASDVIDRTTQFHRQKERERIHQTTRSSEEYNRLLETTVTCRKAVPEDIPRLAELSQRANRFNLTGSRYTVDEITRMLDNKAYSVFSLFAADRFGDMGLVAMAVLCENRIVSFILSCRVFDRDFELVLLQKLQAIHGTDIVGLFHPTGKNTYCKDFYSSHGIHYEIC